MVGAKGRVGIVGAGILGRLTAFFLLDTGWEITIFEEGPENPNNSSFSPSYAAAGMIAPYCELENRGANVTKLGFDSLALWPSIVERVGGNVFFQREGSLVVTHSQERQEFQGLQRTVEKFIPNPEMKLVNRDEIKEYEPDLDPSITEGLFFPLEGQIDGAGILAALGAHLEANGVTFHYNTKAIKIEAGRITTDAHSLRFDCVADCRGMGAKADLKNLRGVRGEIVRLHAPDVSLRRPVRLMHPRYPIYVVPRPDHNYIVGATTVESEDLSEISVRGALELLSALYSLNSGFSEARIKETAVQLRPAFLDNAPKVFHKKGLCRANGLYRHGYLSSPKVAALTAAFISEGKIEEGYESLFEPES